VQSLAAELTAVGFSAAAATTTVPREVTALASEGRGTNNRHKWVVHGVGDLLGLGSKGQRTDHQRTHVKMLT
jgi:hypothetical protein